MNVFTEECFYELLIECVESSGTMPNVLALPIRDLLRTEGWACYGGGKLITSAGDITLKLSSGGVLLTSAVSP
jgi:hypothetical protein